MHTLMDGTMLLKLTAALFLATSLPLVAAAAGADDYSLVSITSPKPGVDLSAVKEVKIAWESLLGDEVDYSVVYSADGRRFDREIASKLNACEIVWRPDDRIGLVGWIKVKAFRDGYLMGESTVPVRFVPPDAIVVSKRDQKVFHFSKGRIHDVLTCSTALPKYDLKEGRYKVYLRERKHWSKEWEVWMPHSLFFHRGYALHATSVVRRLGHPASHGCIRLSPKDAEKLYSEVAVGTPVIVLPKSKSCSAIIALGKEDEPLAKPALSASSR